MSHLKEAIRFAKKAHEGQYRKYNKLPYIVHPARVAARASLVSSTNNDLVIVAWLHDVIEDTDYTAGDIQDRFGVNVSLIVADLTNSSKEYPHLKRAERKKMDRLRLADVGWEAKVVKMIDRTDNLFDLRDAPEDFKRVYVDESELLFDVLVGTDEQLEKEYKIAMEIIKKGIEK